MPRMPPVDPDELPDEYDVIAKKREQISDEVTTEWWNSQPTVQAFGNNPELTRAHVWMNVFLWTETGLSPAEVEYVILAVALEVESEFIWHDHAIAALNRAGIDESSLIALAKRELSAFDDSIATLLAYTFEYIGSYGRVSDPTHAALAEHYSRSEIIGITMLAAYYVFMTHVERALELGRDDEFLGWKLENKA